MITETYTVISKTETLRDIPSADLRRDNPYRRVIIGVPIDNVEFPDSITVEGEISKGLFLGQKLRLSLELVDSEQA